jgi:EAL domain-containing protein (putative c-di-GMP-specific phosphodiesterase class I)
MGAKRLREKYRDFIINVNLSYNQLEKPNFVDMVLEALAETNYPPECLCLEITERCRLLDMDLLKNIVVNLRGRVIKIALDDFGTGFSSIGIVKSLPFDVIKIDRSLVMKIEEKPQDRQLVGSVADMVVNYGSKVCVEGIETSGMRDILNHYHVESFQGYYYAKPLMLEQFLTWRKRK